MGRCRQNIKRTSVEIVASEMMILGDRHDANQSGAEPQDSDIINEEDYPF
jgi:hypothetical protein